MIRKSYSNLCQYCSEQDFMGWDNFDGLNSSIFKKSPFYQYPLARLVWIQAFKRSPLNFRKLLRVPKGYNAKGLALFVSGLVAAGKIEEAKCLIEKLKGMVCAGYSGVSWGYNFDWQSKMSLTPLGTPNIVTTVFVANAFLDYYEINFEKENLALAIDSCRFICENLILFEDDRHLCFRYTPGSVARVHNVNMMAASLLARVWTHTSNPDYYHLSKKAMTYSIDSMNHDFSWFYGEYKLQKFIDNFHTGFNLVSLNDWMKYTGENDWEDLLQKAFKYYRNNFWLENGCPKYYHNRLYPIDIHASAQGIVTFLKLEKHYDQSLDKCLKIAGWAIKNMQGEKGEFYYQKTRFYINKTPYIRWSQAWMLYSLSLLKVRCFDSR